VHEVTRSAFGRTLLRLRGRPRLVRQIGGHGKSDDEKRDEERLRRSAIGGARPWSGPDRICGDRGRDRKIPNAVRARSVLKDG
jgi:hypothetical protein